MDRERGGERVFKLNGKALRVRETLVFEDTEGRELCKIQSRVLRVRDSMEIEGPDGERLAMVKKAVISPLRERWVVDRPDRPDLKVQGNIVDHEYEIEADGRRSPRSPSAGSACATPTASRSRPGRTTPHARRRGRDRLDDGARLRLERARLAPGA